MGATLYMRRVQQILTLDTVLTAIVAILFTYFTWSSNRWVEGLEGRTGVVEKEQGVAAVERAQLKTEIALTYREIKQRLDEISADVKAIKSEQR